MAQLESAAKGTQIDFFGYSRAKILDWEFIRLLVTKDGEQNAKTDTETSGGKLYSDHDQNSSSIKEICQENSLCLSLPGKF